MNSQSSLKALTREILVLQQSFWAGPERVSRSATAAWKPWAQQWVVCLLFVLKWVHFSERTLPHQLARVFISTLSRFPAEVENSAVWVWKMLLISALRKTCLRWYLNNSIVTWTQDEGLLTLGCGCFSLTNLYLRWPYNKLLLWEWSSSEYGDTNMENCWFCDWFPLVHRQSCFLATLIFFFKDIALIAVKVVAKLLTVVERVESMEVGWKASENHICKLLQWYQEKFGPATLISVFHFLWAWSVNDLESKYRTSALNHCVICVLTSRCGDYWGPVCECSEGPSSAVPSWECSEVTRNFSFTSCPIWGLPLENFPWWNRSTRHVCLIVGTNCSF